MPPDRPARPRADLSRAASAPHNDPVCFTAPPFMSPPNLMRRIFSRPLFTLPAHRTNGALLFTLLVSLSCTAASCQSGQINTNQAAATVGAQSSQDVLGDHVDSVRTIVFQDSTASAAVQVFLEPGGGFLVADAGQSQIRAYSPDADLLWTAGRSGDGPEDFRQLRYALRNSSGEVIALDISGKLVFFDAEGAFVRTAATGLTPAFNLRLINDSTLLLSGRRPGDLNTPLLHVWDLRRDTITTSFFLVPAHDPAFDEAYRLNGWASIALLGRDSVAAVFPLSDTLYLFRTDGTELGKLRLPLDHFVPIRTPTAENDTPEAEIAWRNSYSTLSQVFRSSDGSIFIQYYKNNGFEPVWGLSRFSLQNGRLEKSFEVNGSPRLLAISPWDSSLYFLRADNLESTEWFVASLSR